METAYNIGDLRKLIAESAKNEFAPKKGVNVDADDKKNSDKFYKEAEKISKEHYGQTLEAPKTAKYVKTDGNRTMTDVRPDFEPTEEYKERLSAQVKGYTSKDEENNGFEKAAEYDDKAFKAFKETGKKIHKNQDNFGHLGIWGHNMPKDMIGYPDLYENKNVKTIYFKKTQFLGESHMISKIPDEFKNEGCVFKMRDKEDNTYLLEWSDNKANIIGHEHKKRVDETIDRMKALMGYKTGDMVKNSTPSERLNEDNIIEKTLNNARKMM